MDWSIQNDLTDFSKVYLLQLKKYNLTRVLAYNQHEGLHMDVPITYCLGILRQFLPLVKNLLLTNFWQQGGSNPQSLVPSHVVLPS